MRSDQATSGIRKHVAYIPQLGYSPVTKGFFANISSMLNVVQGDVK